MLKKLKIAEKESLQSKINNLLLAKEQIESMKILLEKLDEFKSNINEFVPKNRNFDIEVIESETGVKIKLKHKETGKEKDLNSFLPPDVFFGKDDIYCFRPKEKKIWYKKNEIEYRGFLLALFHEIGHSHDKVKYNITKWESLKAFWYAVTKIIKNKYNKKKDIQDKDNQEKEDLKKSTLNDISYNTDKALPLWFIEKRSITESKSERKAWAYALITLRKLNQEGYDVFLEFENVKQIQDLVAYYLCTYDIKLLLKRLFSVNLEKNNISKQEIKPVYLKKVKMYNRDTIMNLLNNSFAKEIQDNNINNQK